MGDKADKVVKWVEPCRQEILKDCGVHNSVWPRLKKREQKEGKKKREEAKARGEKPPKDPRETEPHCALKDCLLYALQAQGKGYVPKFEW